jgi:hypothetical protein
MWLLYSNRSAQSKYNVNVALGGVACIKGKMLELLKLNFTPVLQYIYSVLSVLRRTVIVELLTRKTRKKINILRFESCTLVDSPRKRGLGNLQRTITCYR